MPYIKAGKYHFNLDQVVYFTEDKPGLQSSEIIVHFANRELEPVKLTGAELQAFLKQYGDLPKAEYR